jgi:hypothetical protein
LTFMVLTSTNPSPGADVNSAAMYSPGFNAGR